MFYGQCWKCGERWSLGTASTCTCEPKQPQRTWVGLTTEDMATCIAEPAWDLILRKADQILKEKNT